jgi:hypothetical protein
MEYVSIFEEGKGTIFFCFCAQFWVSHHRLYLHWLLDRPPINLWIACERTSFIFGKYRLECLPVFGFPQPLPPTHKQELGILRWSMQMSLPSFLVLQGLSFLSISFTIQGDSKIYGIVSWMSFRYVDNKCSLKLKLISMVWVRERTIPTERPPLVGEVIANFCG